jgi:hypothetical protein
VLFPVGAKRVDEIRFVSEVPVTDLLIIALDEQRITNVHG